MKAHHNYPIAGHPGWWKMAEIVACNFWWTRMGHYVADYVKGCNLCNCMKTYPVSPFGKLIPNQVPDCQWQVISVNIIMELQLS